MYRLVMDKINSKIKLSLVFSRGGKSAQDPSITKQDVPVFLAWKRLVQQYMRENVGFLSKPTHCPRVLDGLSSKEVKP